MKQITIRGFVRSSSFSLRSASGKALVLRSLKAELQTGLWLLVMRILPTFCTFVIVMRRHIYHGPLLFLCGFLWLLVTSPLLASDTTLKLNKDRFALSLVWKNYNTGLTGNAQAVSLTENSGYFWFFGHDNVEIVIKILNGRALNGCFWVLFGSITDVEFLSRQEFTRRWLSRRTPAAAIITSPIPPPPECRLPSMDRAGRRHGRQRSNSLARRLMLSSTFD